MTKVASSFSISRSTSTAILLVKYATDGMEEITFIFKGPSFMHNIFFSILFCVCLILCSVLIKVSLILILL